jgi:hypothetical protein
VVHFGPDGSLNLTMNPYKDSDDTDPDQIAEHICAGATKLDAYETESATWSLYSAHPGHELHEFPLTFFV